MSIFGHTLGFDNAVGYVYVSRSATSAFVVATFQASALYEHVGIILVLEVLGCLHIDFGLLEHTQFSLLLGFAYATSADIDYAGVAVTTAVVFTVASSTF